MTPTALPAYAGIVVSDVAVSVAWYTRVLDCSVDEAGQDWSCLVFPDGSTVELFRGDPSRPGSTFPSYGDEAAARVMPGYAVDDPDLAVHGLRVARSLPDWHVVVAPDGLRVVVTWRETDKGVGLVGFRFATPAVSAVRAFMETLGAADSVDWGPEPAVVPRFAAGRSARLTDPDGTPIELVAGADTLAGQT